MIINVAKKKVKACEPLPPNTLLAFLNKCGFIYFLEDDNETMRKALGSPLKDMIGNEYESYSASLEKNNLVKIKIHNTTKRFDITVFYLAPPPEGLRTEPEKDKQRRVEANREAMSNYNKLCTAIEKEYNVTLIEMVN